MQWGVKNVCLGQVFVCVCVCPHHCTLLANKAPTTMAQESSTKGRISVCQLFQALLLRWSGPSALQQTPLPTGFTVFQLPTYASKFSSCCYQRYVGWDGGIFSTITPTTSSSHHVLQLQVWQAKYLLCFLFLTFSLINFAYSTKLIYLNNVFVLLFWKLI